MLQEQLSFCACVCVCACVKVGSQRFLGSSNGLQGETVEGAKISCFSSLWIALRLQRCTHVNLNINKAHSACPAAQEKAICNDNCWNGIFASKSGILLANDHGGRHALRCGSGPG